MLRLAAFAFSSLLPIVALAASPAAILPSQHVPGTFWAFFYEDTNVGTPAATFSATKHPNISGILTGNAPTPATEGATIIANGYQLVVGFPYDLAWCMSNSANCVHASSPNRVAWAQQTIDCFIAGKVGTLVPCTGGYAGYPHVKGSYINEPDFPTPAAANNAVLAYVNGNYPGTTIGPIYSANYGAPAGITELSEGVNWTNAFVEDFDAGGGGPPNRVDPWALARASFPRSALGEMLVSSVSICHEFQAQSTIFGGVDPKIILWNLNTFGHWSGLPLEDGWLINGPAFAATGSKAICTLPQPFLVAGNTEVGTNTTFTGSISGTTLTTSGGAPAIGMMIQGTNGSGVLADTLITAGGGTSWTVNNSQTVSSISMTGQTVHTGSSFTITALGADNASFSGYTAAAPLTGGSSACKYRVLSGPNAIYGPNATGMTQTLGWTNRTCGSNPPAITIGASGNCRSDSTFNTATSNIEPACIVEFQDTNANGQLGINLYLWYYIGGI